MRWPLGVMYMAYGEVSLEDAAEAARADGFEHLGAFHDTGNALALPIGDRYSPRPSAGCTSGPLPAGKRSFEQTVADFRAAPGARLEPWPGSVIGSDESLRAILAELPGLELTLDVGHVRAWGGDPVEWLERAGHVQLRQAKPGRTQAPDGDGDVDFAAVLKRLDAIGYDGLLTVEYFDLPERGAGWSVADPRAAALETAKQVRALFS